jgi:hypothetical protein
LVWLASGDLWNFDDPLDVQPDELLSGFAHFPQSPARRIVAELPTQNPFELTREFFTMLQALPDGEEPNEFAYQIRKLVESDRVSSLLHWIDRVFRILSPFSHKIFIRRHLSHSALAQIVGFPAVVQS